MHSMKKHRNKQPEISNISAEKVTSESSAQNETSLEITEDPDKKSKFCNIRSKLVLELKFFASYIIIF